MTLFVTIENAFKANLFTWSFEQGHDRSIGCYFSDWTFRWSIWVGTMASWSRDATWCRWWRQGHIDFTDLVLGKTTYRREVVKSGLSLHIPMPEGVYPATAQIEHATWKRPRWFAKQRTYVQVDVPNGGLPFSGKGDNSWDCGDDGLCGYSVEGTSLEKAIAHGIEVALTNRRRYGMPSRQALAGAMKR